MLTNPLATDTLETNIFNMIVGYDENESNSKKKIRSKRAFAARRAIEKYRETKQLALHIDEVWCKDGLN